MSTLKAESEAPAVFCYRRIVPAIFVGVVVVVVVAAVVVVCNILRRHL